MSVEHYVLTRSQRKSLTISIANAEVIVRAPLDLDLETINKFVDKKRAWIAQKLQQQHQRLAEVPCRQYQSGEAWPYLGGLLELELITAKRCNIQRFDDKLRLASPRFEREYLSKKLEQWYKSEAMLMFSQKAQQLAARSGIDYRQVKVRKTKTRWGHCTRDGVLQFNWLLIQAPEYVVDYVVAHELCHRVHFNHSANFWRLVNSLCCDVAGAKHWLKAHGHTLSM